MPLTNLGILSSNLICSDVFRRGPSGAPKTSTTYASVSVSLPSGSATPIAAKYRDMEMAGTLGGHQNAFLREDMVAR